MIIIAHSPQAAICLQDQAEKVARRDRLHPSGQNLNRRVTLGRRPVTEIAVAVVSHRPQAAVSLQNQAVTIAPRDRLYPTG